MNTNELFVYRQTKSEIQDTIEGKSYQIIGTTELQEVPFLVMKNNSTLKAIPISLVKQDRPSDIARTTVSTVGLPSFTENQWLEKNIRVKNLLTEYAIHTYPKLSNSLTNKAESQHQGYEGSVQEFQRPKKGPDPANGLDYDKARGTIKKWK